jgi:hypothetical protein
MPIDPTKDSPLPDRRGRQPATQRPDRTRRFFSSKRDRHGGAGPFAIVFERRIVSTTPSGSKLRSPTSSATSSLRRSAAAQRGHPANEQQRPIAQPPQIHRDI